MAIKAFMVFSGYPCDGCLLVFAETRNKAKAAALNHSFEWEYIHMNTRRQPDYDKYSCEVGLTVIDDNDGLPSDAPDFYSEYKL